LCEDGINVEIGRPVFEAKSNRTLPPLILHPFSDSSSPERLALSTRASLVLQGLLPDEGLGDQELTQRILEGRFCEIRMLFYLGKDVRRWLDQCMEVVDRDDELRQSGIQRESFAVLLIDAPPEAVREKLRSWGVVDFKVIFRRALGLHTLFAVLPERDSLATDFLRSYQSFTDRLFEFYIESVPAPRLRQTDFEFEIYASGEYAKLLEKEWEQ
jgi:hypothetical protein